jgi:hypothetical protein
MVARRGTGGKRNFIVFLGKAAGAFALFSPKNTAYRKEYVGEAPQKAITACLTRTGSSGEQGRFLRRSMPTRRVRDQALPRVRPTAAAPTCASKTNSHKGSIAPPPEADPAVPPGD